MEISNGRKWAKPHTKLFNSDENILKLSYVTGYITL